MMVIGINEDLMTSTKQRILNFHAKIPIFSTTANKNMSFLSRTHCFGLIIFLNAPQQPQDTTAMVLEAFVDLFFTQPLDNGHNFLVFAYFPQYCLIESQLPEKLERVLVLETITMRQDLKK